MRQIILALLFVVFSTYSAWAQSTTSPLWNPNLRVAGSNSTTGTSATTLIPAQPTATMNIVGLQCSNTSATTVTVQLNDSANSTFIVPTGSGTNVVFSEPLAVLRNNPLTFTSSASESTIYCNAQGYVTY